MRPGSSRAPAAERPRRRRAPARASAGSSNSGRANRSSASGAWPQCPSRAFAYRIGNSIWCSSASRSRKSSSTSWTTSSTRASGRSTLLTTRTTGRRASSAFRSTNRVWGSGPSEASTSSSTPSTIVSAALDLAAEIRVPRRVDDVDLDIAEAHRRVLGEDRDALLALEVHRVHHPLRDLLVRAEGARLPQHGVDQGCLAVVHVGNDGHVADVVSGRHPPSVEMTRDHARVCAGTVFRCTKQTNASDTARGSPPMVRPLHPKERQVYSRRAFLQRAAAAGIALPSLSAILAACGSGAAEQRRHVGLLRRRRRQPVRNRWHRAARRIRSHGPTRP